MLVYCCKVFNECVAAACGDVDWIAECHLFLLESTMAIRYVCIATVDRCGDGKVMVMLMFVHRSGSVAMRLCLPVCLI